MSKFTQGNWYVEDGYIFAETGEYIASVASVCDYTTDDANARLIAAAPEMYDELYEVLQLLKGLKSYDDDMFDVHAKSIKELFKRIDVYEN